MGRSAPKCAVCGAVIGVYEPVLVVDEGALRQTSLAAEPHLLEDPSELHHASCQAAPVHTQRSASA